MVTGFCVLCHDKLMRMSLPQKCLPSVGVENVHYRAALGKCFVPITVTHRQSIFYFLSAIFVA